MKILMDADCLIKLTKAGLKEHTVALCNVTIPDAVYVEAVVAGKQKGCDDAIVIEANVSQKKINVLDQVTDSSKGDDALIELFDHELFSAVGTDDAKLVKRLRTNGIPFILPAVIILKFFETELIDQQKALRMLDQLSAFISSDEHAMVKAMIRGKQ
jgi:rRNA-processing protein FCF1